MKELNEEELLRNLTYMKYVYDKGVDEYTCSTRRAKEGVDQACQQMKEMIQKPAKKPTVPKVFIENMTNRMEQMMMQKSRRKDREYFIRCEVLRAAGVEEKK